MQSPDAQCDLTHCAEHLNFGFSESTRTRHKATGIRGAWCGPYLANTAPAHASYARQSRRGYWYCHPRPLTRDEIEQLFECLLSQPFVTCE